MSNLIDALPVDTLKALAKRYLKLKKDRGDEPVALMSIQEDLARAAGHRDMHAAQDYWNRKNGLVESTQAAVDILGTGQDNTHEGKFVRAAADRMAQLHGWFSVDALVNDCLRREAKERENGASNASDTAPLVAEKVREAIQDPRYFKTHDGLVTTTAWLDGQRNLAHMAVRHDRAMSISLAQTQRMSAMTDEQVQAVIESCKSDAIIAIESGNGAGKSFVMREVADAYLQAGWKVMATAWSWAGSKVAGESMGVDQSMSIALAAMIGRATKDKEATPFNEPTLVILDSAEVVPSAEMASLAKVAFEALVPVKIVVVGDPANARPHNALAVVCQNARKLALTEGRGHTFVANQEEAIFDGEARAFSLSDKEKAARGVDPAILGRAFLQVMNDPDTTWRDRPFKEFSDAMAARAAELDEAARGARPSKQGKGPGRRGIR